MSKFESWDTQDLIDEKLCLAKELDRIAARIARVEGMVEHMEDVIYDEAGDLQFELDELNDEYTALTERLAQVEARLRRQFSSLDILVAQMRNTGNYLTSQLASLSTSSGNGSKP